MEDNAFQEQRKNMVQKQLIPRGINDRAVLDAMGRVPRHLFVEPAQRHSAYGDYPLPLELEQTISQPYIVALMTQSLGLKGPERVLEIGTGSGYQTAVLAELAQHICTVERLPSLMAQAQKTLYALGYNNISFKTGDGNKGWPAQAPFDAILVAAAAQSIPAPLVEQLAPGGNMVIPVGELPIQNLLLLTKDEKGIARQNLCSCRFVPLIEE